MKKLPTTPNSETFIMRISPELKQKLNELAKKTKYGSASGVIRALIEAESRKSDFSI